MSEEKKTSSTTEPKKDTTSSKGQWHGGKGSLPRKGDNKTAYQDGWERIFGKNKKDN